MPHITIATQATCIDSIVTGGLEVVLKVIFLIPFNLAKVPFFLSLSRDLKYWENSDFSLLKWTKCSVQFMMALAQNINFICIRNYFLKLCQNNVDKSLIICKNTFFSGRTKWIKHNSFALHFFQFTKILYLSWGALEQASVMSG